ncbi:MAG TPA: helix-turn-helix domain-containing protein [Gemmatimonadales bacterium]|jgi:AcrR family transcriptional regulator
MRHGESKQTILAAARTEFGEHGYAGARISRIAARARLNKQLIYYYFGSKSGLYAAATSEGPAVVPAAANPRAPAPDVVRAALARILTSLEARPDMLALAVDRHPAADAAPQGRAWITQAVGEITAAVSRGQGMGYFRDDVDAESIALQALVSCLGFLAVRRHLDVSADTWVREVGDTLLRATAWG